MAKWMGGGKMVLVAKIAARWGDRPSSFWCWGCGWFSCRRVRGWAGGGGAAGTGPRPVRECWLPDRRGRPGTWRSAPGRDRSADWSPTRSKNMRNFVNYHQNWLIYWLLSLIDEWSSLNTVQWINYSGFISLFHWLLSLISEYDSWMKLNNQ